MFRRFVTQGAVRSTRIQPRIYPRGFIQHRSLFVSGQDEVPGSKEEESGRRRMHAALESRVFRLEDNLIQVSKDIVGIKGEMGDLKNQMRRIEAQIVLVNWQWTILLGILIIGSGSIALDRYRYVSALSQNKEKGKEM
ncbi:uncharacterized protein H6S33_011110 [Morchella sextelata]|uniref:uncharacterized protein n=1 Tax=Morchella sextelata TaxID=1174677 RepID=UPI001D043950|nr:uncharacterized protein H6S33_011110 [Morchella sextelata]KAH0611845.1 hypothetical protein H6S33_011110 [Morchella sextelata]